MLRAFGHPVATCCDMLGIAGPNLKMVKFFMQHLWLPHDVVARATMLRLSTRTSSIFNSQHVATRCNNVHLLLRSFGQNLQMLGQQCWDLLR